MDRSSGKVIGVNGNMVSVLIEGVISLNEVGYIIVGEKRLKAEVIRINGDRAEMQVFEMTGGIGVGDSVDFSGELLAVELGPGLLTQIYDGLQNPLPELAEECGFFLQRGIYLSPLSREEKWDYTPKLKTGDTVTGGDTIGTVPEGIFEHRIMVPFNMQDSYKVINLTDAGSYNIDKVIAVVADENGKEISLTMSFQWPVKRAIDLFEERLKPQEPMVTKVRLIDTFFPVALGGTFCIPGPFGAGKTVLQQITSRHAEVDIVIIAACGERAGEVVETLKEFPELIDPKTGKSLQAQCR